VVSCCGAVFLETSLSSCGPAPNRGLLGCGSRPNRSASERVPRSALPLMVPQCPSPSVAEARPRSARGHRRARLPGHGHAGRGQDHRSPCAPRSTTWRRTPGAGSCGGADLAPQAPVGRRRRRRSACTSSPRGPVGTGAARPTSTASSPPTSRCRPTRTRCAPWPRRPGVLDEIHHAGDDRAWGDVGAGVRRRAPRAGAVGHAVPLRHPAIPFVATSATRPAPTSSTATPTRWRDGRVVRPVYFPRINGFMEWIAPDGAPTPRFDDALDRCRPPSGCAPR
jgi:hypothetical protein